MKKYMKNAKRYLLCLVALVVVLGTLTACGNKMTTYTYDNEAVLDIRIKKTEVYSDKLVVTFANNSLASVESVVCYGLDFSVIEKEPQFSFRGNILTIETQDADLISGLRVEENENLYFKVRYLDSDSYAMLVYAWADDLGYEGNGDEDAYYTQEEKDEQEANAIALAEAEEVAYSKLLGSWINESETVRIDFAYAEDGLNKEFTVYELVADEWTVKEVMYITAVSEEEAYESFEITLYDNPSWGFACSFYLSNDNLEMECSYSDEKFVKM